MIMNISRFAIYYSIIVCLVVSLSLSFYHEPIILVDGFVQRPLNLATTFAFQSKISRNNHDEYQNRRRVRQISYEKDSIADNSGGIENDEASAMQNSTETTETTITLRNTTNTITTVSGTTNKTTNQEVTINSNNEGFLKRLFGRQQNRKTSGNIVLKSTNNNSSSNSDDTASRISMLQNVVNQFTSATTDDQQQQQQQEEMTMDSSGLQMIEKVMGKNSPPFTLWTLLNSNDPIEQMSLLDAWKESLQFDNNATTNTTDVKPRENITSISTWIISWKRELQNQDLNQIGDHIWRYVLGDWSKIRQNQTLIMSIRAICIAVLTWGFIETILTTITMSIVWTFIALTQSSQQSVTISSSWMKMIWKLLTQQNEKMIFYTYGLVRLKLDPLLFVLKAIGTLLIVPYYENLVCTIENICFSNTYQQKFPLISRIQALILSCLVGYFLSRILLTMGIFSGTLLVICKNMLMSLLFRTI